MFRQYGVGRLEDLTKGYFGLMQTTETAYTAIICQHQW